MTAELAAAAGFVGMAVAVPLVNLLTLLAFAGYLFWLNPLLAAVSFSIYPAVLFLVPMLQKRVNHYNRKRVDANRSFSGRIGESVDGIHEIKANAAFGLESRNLGERIERLRKIRITWKLYRFAVKVINNLFTNFSRFLIFSLGGYLALNGRLELGRSGGLSFGPGKALRSLERAHPLLSGLSDRGGHLQTDHGLLRRGHGNGPGIHGWRYRSAEGQDGGRKSVIYHR